MVVTFCLRSSCYTGLTGLLEERPVREMKNGRGRRNCRVEQIYVTSSFPSSSLLFYASCSYTVDTISFLPFFSINILKIFYKYIYRLPFNYARNKIKFSSKVPNPSRMRREEVASRVAFDRLPSNRNSEERRRRKRKRRKEE